MGEPRRVIIDDPEILAFKAREAALRSENALVQEFVNSAKLQTAEDCLLLADALSTALDTVAINTAETIDKISNVAEGLRAVAEAMQAKNFSQAQAAAESLPDDWGVKEQVKEMLERTASGTQMVVEQTAFVDLSKVRRSGGQKAA